METSKVAFLHRSGDWKPFNSEADLVRIIEFSLRNTEDPKSSPGSIMEFSLLRYKDGGTRVMLYFSYKRIFKRWLIALDVPFCDDDFVPTGVYKSETNRTTRMILEKILDNTSNPLDEALRGVIKSQPESDAALERAVAEYDR